jgi:predicted dehydrogenase
MEHIKLLNHYTRRKFIYDLSRNIGITALGIQGISAFSACGNGGSGNPATQSEGQPAGTGAAKKLGIALVGLGKYSSGQLAPALQETKQCYLAGIVTGSPDKADKWKSKYNIPDKNIYNYQNFDSIKDNPDIDIVYVVLPNAMHAEYVIRAAKAGKHVICEKPMATNVEDCQRMIDACKEAGKMLSIGYRLHFEPHNLEMMRLGKEKAFGDIKKIYADDGMGDVEGWRLDKNLAGGGPLMDVGIYCIQGARYTTGAEPIAVMAQEVPKKHPDKFKNIEEALNWQMEFPGNIIATCKTSYSEDMNRLRAEAEKGWFELSPAYAYSGIKGKTINGPMELPNVNQQARQMDDFAVAISTNRPTPVSGEMGMQDVKIMMAIYESMKTGKRVTIT